jgi:hypothetical protein
MWTCRAAAAAVVVVVDVPDVEATPVTVWVVGSLPTASGGAVSQVTLEMAQAPVPLEYPTR